MTGIEGTGGKVVAITGAISGIGSVRMPESAGEALPGEVLLG